MDDATEKEHSRGHKVNKEEEMIPQGNILSEEDNNGRGTTFTGGHAKNVNSPRKRKSEKSAAAQRAEKLRMKKIIINSKENTAPMVDLTSVDLTQRDTCHTVGAVTNSGLLFRELLRDNQSCRGNGNPHGDSHTHGMGMGMGKIFSLWGSPWDIRIRFH